MPFSPRLRPATDPAEDAITESKFSIDKAAKKAARRAERAQLCTVIEALDDVDAKVVDEKAARKAAKRAERERLAQNTAAEAADAEVADEKAARKAAKRAERERLAQEAEAAEEKAARKAAKRAERERQAQQTEQAESSQGNAKRQTSQVAEFGVEAEAKRRKLEDGQGVPSNKRGAEAFRKVHEIIVPSSCPAPIETFDAAVDHLGERLTKALRAQGYAAPTPIQAQAWPIALSGQDMVAVAKTGSGKTCGFLMPALARLVERGPGSRAGRPATPCVLVLAPTRELAQQIAVEAQKFAPSARARVAILFGGAPRGAQIGELMKDRGTDILIATPGRLLDLCAGCKVTGKPPAVSLEAVTYLVLDEADRMIDQGFGPEVKKIVDMCPLTGTPEEGGGAGGAKSGTRRQTLFFTATWPKAVQEAAASYTSQNAVQVRIGQGSHGDKLTANKDVTQEVVVCDPKDKLDKLKEYLSSELGSNETVIVFAQTKVGCADIERQLKQSIRGMWICAIHGDKDQWQRDQALGEFRELTSSGRQGALIATDVAARGLDIPGVPRVVVYDFGRGMKGANTGVESYVHRIGRTGRAGKRGHALTFFTEEDSGARELIALLEGAKQEVPAELQEMADQESWKRWQKNGKGKGKGKGRGKGKGGKGKSRRSW